MRVQLCTQSAGYSCCSYAVWWLRHSWKASRWFELVGPGVHAHLLLAPRATSRMCLAMFLGALR